MKFRQTLPRFGRQTTNWPGRVNLIENGLYLSFPALECRTTASANAAGNPNPPRSTMCVCFSCGVSFFPLVNRRVAGRTHTYVRSRASRVQPAKAPSISQWSPFQLATAGHARW
jgi:hypothetical protein